MTKINEKWGDDTKNIRIQTPKSYFREHSAPIYLSSSFVFDNAEQGARVFNEDEEGTIYSRYSNPNVDEFIHKVCEMEGCEDGFAFASGMSAVFNSMAALLKSGDHVLTCRSVFGSTHQIFSEIFPRWGISYTYVDASAPELWESEIRDCTKMIFVETPSNPGLEIIDLDFLMQLKKKYNLILNVDNCFATPILQKPAEFDADLITHSATKFMDGQGRVLGGITVGKYELIDQIRFFCRHTGPAMSPFNAWVLSKSLETLSLRVHKHCENAEKLAEYFSGHSNLESVKYPFLENHPQYKIALKQMSKGGGLVTFEFKDQSEAMSFINKLTIPSITSNLGDTRTIVTHPASTTHSKLTKEEREKVCIKDGLVRISLGLENIEDLIKDFKNALEN